MASPDFHIEIVTQGWITPSDPTAATWDLCTHGDVRLTIGGEVIAPGAAATSTGSVRQRSVSFGRSRPTRSQSGTTDPARLRPRSGPATVGIGAFPLGQES